MTCVARQFCSPFFLDAKTCLDAKSGCHWPARLALAAGLAILAPLGANAQTTDQLVKGATDTICWRCSVPNSTDG